MTATASATTTAPAVPTPALVVALALALALPWLDPFASGPSAAVQPLLFSWFCCGGLALFAAPSRGFAAGLALAAGWLALLVWGVAAQWLAASVRDWLPLLAAALAVAVCCGVARQPRWRRGIVLALLAAALLSAAIGLLQYFGIAADFHPWLNIAPAGEAFGNLRQRNQLASLLNIGLAALLWLLAAPTAQAAGASPLRALAAPAAVLLALGNAATASRTGFVQLLLLAALAGWWWWLQRRDVAQHGVRRAGGRQVLLPALIAYALGALLLPTLAGLDPNQYGPFARLANGAAPCASRLVLWSNVRELIQLKPWTGWGLNELDYAHFVHLYDGPRFCDILDNAHNLPLQLAVEFGLPVALLLCGALLLLVLRAAPWRESCATRQLGWSVLAVVGVHSLLEYPLWYGPFQMACGLAVGWLWPCAQARPGDGFYEEKRPFALVCRSLTAILIIALCGFAARDYQRVSQIYRPPQEREPALRANPIAQLGRSPLFADQVRFARLTTLPLTRENAAEVHALAGELLHFSPEPRVVERLIDSARLLGRETEAAFYEARFKAAFAKDFANRQLREAGR